MCIILLNRLLKVWDVQSGPLGVMMFNSGAGSGVGKRCAWGCNKKKFVTLFLDNMSAAQFVAPAICSAKIQISKKATKNHRYLRRCITEGSFEYPLEIQDTKLLLSH